AYNVPVVLRLEGRLEVAALWRSVRDLLRRHAVLRLRIELVGGAARATTVAAEAIELAEESCADEAAARERARAEARRPVGLDGPLVRVRLLRVGSGDRVNLLVLTLHHLVCDGGSLGVLLAELGQRYGRALRGEAEAEAEEGEGVEYADYAYAQRRQAERG